MKKKKKRIYLENFNKSDLKHVCRRNPPFRTVFNIQEIINSSLICFFYMHASYMFSLV